MSFSFQPAAPKAGTPGVAEPSAPAGSPPASGGSGPFGGMSMTLLMVLAIVPMLLLSFRRQKKEQAARKNLKKGDRVVTNAGLIGELIDMDEQVARVKVAPGTTVQVLASALASFAPTAEKKTEKELSDLKEAKLSAAEKK